MSRARRAGAHEHEPPHGPAPALVAMMMSYVDTRIGEEADGHRALVEAQLAGLSALSRERLDSLQRAIDKAEAQTDIRFHNVNEFRAALSDQAATFPSRGEMDAHYQANASRIVELASRLDKIEGRSVGVLTDRETRRQSTMVLIAAVSIIVTILIAGITIWASTGR